MKKTVVTILLVLPFLLIYFISFTGQILSSYKHIYVERITVLDAEGREYKEGDYIKLGINEEYDLKIKIYPELASDKTVLISNGNKAVCEIDSETHKIKTLDYGVSKLIITSKDRHFIQFIINIRVAQDDIEDIVLSSNTVDVTKGRSQKVDVSILPTTALLEFRELIWQSMDTSIAKVSQDGLITGVNFGQTTVRVSSKHKPELYKDITVNVSLELGTGVFFANEEPEKIFEVNVAEFDLKTITIINLNGVTQNDVWYQLGSSINEEDIDALRLSEGIIKFNKQKTPVIIVVNAYANDKDYTDTITIWFVKNN